MRSSVVPCVKCAQLGCVLIQAKPAITDDKIKLIFVCTNKECIHKWQD
jgi:hypothetical protein